jgi:hypothetical protein
MLGQSLLPELFWPCDASDAESTLVFEYDPTSSSTANPGTSGSVSRIVSVGNPSRSVIKLYAPGLADRIAAISVYDVAGRLVERAIPVQDAPGTLVWAPRRLAAGVYVIRAETNHREVLATRRVVFVR